MLFILAAALTIGLASATNPEGQAYLDKNAEKDGVVSLLSGKHKHPARCTEVFF